MTELTQPRVTRYTLGGWDPLTPSISVELTCEAGQGPHKPPHDWWAVRDGRGCCLNSDGEWEYEPQPSSRKDDFLARTRFTEQGAIAVARVRYDRDQRHADERRTDV